MVKILKTRIEEGALRGVRLDSLILKKMRGFCTPDMNTH